MAKKRKPGPPKTILNERAYNAALKDRARTAARAIQIDFTRLNQRRRNKGRANPEFFLRTYFPHIFYLPFCGNQRRNIAALAEKMEHGGFKAIADTRGGGKTSITKGMVIRGLVYGIIRWVPWIEANSDMARDSLEDIRLMFETVVGDDLFGADFAEYCTPIRLLEGQSQRARTQTFQGKRTMMKLDVNRIILPTIDGIANPARGGIIQAFGADKPIRGLVRQGKRPDFVAINDIETEDTAKSPTMTENIRRNIVNSVLGLGGPGEKFGATILCTISRRGCVADMFTDRAQYPQWHGERMRMLASAPDNADLWTKYIDVRKREQRLGDPDARAAEAFYRENRAAMDAGAEVANEHRFDGGDGADGRPKEISALQHVYNIIADRGEEYFACECQNDPPEEVSDKNEIETHVIAEKVNGLPRCTLPSWTERVVLFADVHDNMLYWAACAFRQGFTGAIIDYGVDPVHSPVVGSVATAERIQQVDMAIREALHALRTRMADGWQIQGSPERRRLDLGLVDAGYKDTAVYQYIRESPGGIWRPAIGGSSIRGGYTSPKPSKTVRYIGDGHHMSYLVSKAQWVLIHDANKFKRRVQDGFLTPDMDATGSLSLFGDEPTEHHAFAEQIIAEAYNTEKMKFEVRKGYRHNHWLDCAAGCCAGAAAIGISLVPAAYTPRPQRTVVSQQKNMRTSY